VFLEALLMSPNARGYLLGSLSELLLRQHLEPLGYQTKRIKEKWVGPKLHHGDYYVSRDGQRWFVLESKGLKSNSEDWHNLAAVDPNPSALKDWFERMRSGEMRSWWHRLPASRRERILSAGTFNQARVLETHFVSGTAGRAGREIATPRKSEFHVVALDLFLRTQRHEFIFAPTRLLPPADKFPQHLKQNYLIDILVPGVDEKPVLPSPWTWNFNAVFDKLTKPVAAKDMQVDHRKPGEREGEVAAD
jgi:hypothetical protein